MNEKKEFKKILIIGHANIGDVCYDLVVVNPLRKRFPSAEITFLASPVSKDIVEGYQGLDRVIIFDKYGLDRGLRGRLRLLFSLRKEHFELVVVLKDTLMYKYINAPFRWSVRKYLGCLPIKKRMHIADIYMEFLRSCGVPAQKGVWNFSVAAEGDFCNQFLKQAGVNNQDKIVGILWHSGWSLKDWPAGHWNKLARILTRRNNFKIIAFGKIAQTSQGKEKLKQIADPIISAVNKTTLKQALALIQRCDLFIGTDSSLLHLASCMGVETIGLYGATSKDYIYPYFHYHNIIGPAEKRACMPCYPGLDPCPCMKNKLSSSPCMEGISVEDVAQLVGRKIGIPDSIKKEGLL